ncbi:sigma-70 family RNA polymerase sigma factor [Altererythrobacter sp. BO-6]|uniref:sigma-70 family RNA polymerase sigma factor n=1 Tax=Altererythrobacter sp. BO-6 TaxID=2604537 RepID=UPI0013E151B7|nr:sigma-70 family RNA polymerase sigma factor [Altererythrobacter sp. BO-6]QIG54790.1 sigma-70 family RNA polymerase sigma factor [Altererythrobacter sp. BO-6]
MTDAASEAREQLKSAMARLAAGERDALEQVYRMTRVKLFGICYRILGDRKEAEDALQDVYVNLWQRADRYDPQRASPISWLATFARNRAVDRLRSGKVRQGAVELDEAFGLADTAPLADSLLIDAERQARVHTCLDRLETNQRGNIRAAYFGGQTYAELAEAQGVPLGTMKSWIRRGLAKLKICLEAGE